jgi:hypothetical protein
MKEMGSIFGYFRNRKQAFESFDEISSKRIDPPHSQLGGESCLECIL